MNQEEFSIETTPDYADFVKSRTSKSYNLNHINLCRLHQLISSPLVVSLAADELKRGIFYNDDKRFEGHGEAYNALWRLNPTLRGEEANRLIDLVHGYLGMLSEMEELRRAIVNIIAGRTDGEYNNGDKVNMGEELGDFQFYVQLALSFDKKTIFDAVNANYRKLTKRYKEKFTTQEALNRDLDAEREALEKSLGKN